MICALLFLSGWQVNGWRLDRKYQAREVELIRKATEQRIKNDALINQAETVLNSERLIWQEKFERKRNEVRHVIKVPLPADCKLDSGRMRIATDIATNINTAISGIDSRMPASSSNSGQ